jgi:hypothetical protein
MAEEDVLFVLSHKSTQLQVLHIRTLELMCPFVSLEQELIEFAYDNDTD